MSDFGAKWRRGLRAAAGEAGGSGGDAPSGAGGPASGGPSAARDFLGQLQAMIDNLATQSAPVIREVGAKAAELAAIAAERAGPLAHRAANVTQDVGSRVAERSRDLAAELRRSAEAEPGDAVPGSGGSPPEPEPATGPGDAAADLPR